ncbi:MAG: ketoacyl-ACP synthase III [Lachnospiraceae bacterium]|nr:ketoacyl-ACP synthase III [Lachnospiraceae bacterium]
MFHIIGTGMYVPERIVTNDELATMVDTNDEWIRQRVGIAERRVSTEEWTSEMAYKAALAALENADCKPEDLDYIITATVSGETVSPSTACMVQKLLGATCPAMEINAACSAFLFLLETAAGLFARKKANKILVVGAERLSSIMDWSDRGTCIIFGDGAGAAVLSNEVDGYLDSVVTVQGNDEVIKIPTNVGCSPFFTKENDTPYIHMMGQETFKYAVSSICNDVTTLLTQNNLTLDDIKYIVPHQANKRIIDFAAKRLKTSEDKFFLNIERYGNTSSASIPIALDELNRAGKLMRGDYIILTAFGGGLANAACLIRW